MAVQYNEFSFFSDFDNQEIFAMSIEPEDEIKGVVQLVHGMTEYKERYYDFMEYLAKKGYYTVIHDNRGHGKSVNAKYGLGYMGENGCDGLVEDAHQLTEMIKEELVLKNVDVPYILFGHSMGSMVVRSYIKKYDDEIDKLIVCGCPSKPDFLPAGIALTNIMGRIKLPGDKSKLLDYLCVNGTYEAKFKDEHMQHAWINSDKDAVIKYNADPLCNYTFTVNGYQELVKLTANTYSKKGWKKANLDLPILFVSGREDPCHLGPKNFGKSVHMLKALGYTNVKARLYGGMRHEILNEPHHRRVYLDIYNFIKE